MPERGREEIGGVGREALLRAGERDLVREKAVRHGQNGLEDDPHAGQRRDLSAEVLPGQIDGEIHASAGCGDGALPLFQGGGGRQAENTRHGRRMPLSLRGRQRRPRAGSVEVDGLQDHTRHRRDLREGKNGPREKRRPRPNRREIHLDDREKHKSRYITATIYAGKKTASGRNALTNRTLIPGVEVADVAAKINAALSEAYGLNADSSVYLSGDLAGYIQSFTERLMCKATYVPDKWHVCRFLSSKGSPVKAEDVLKKLESIEETGDITGLSENAAQVYRLWKGNPKIFDPWAKDDYLGCCQEAMNSHYYAPRFGKYANRFKKVTVAMLSMVREARENGWELKISSKSLREEGTSLLATLGRPYEDVVKYDIDTREMDYATRKMFARIEYPDICLSGLR